MPTDTFFRLDNKKKEKIIESAKNEFNIYGFEKAKVTRICENIGIPRRTFYSYFDSLDDIYNYIYNTELSECNKIFNNVNVLSNIRISGFNKEQFIEFEEYYKNVVSSDYGLNKIYKTINDKTFEEKIIFNILVSLFKQYELGIINREEVIEEFNKMAEHINR